MPAPRIYHKVLPGGISEDHPVLSGVPQGTVLGPLLFLIMISDIDKDVSASKLVSFADDTRLYSGVGDVADCDKLQLDLNAVYDWASSNNMFFNSKKFCYVCFSFNASAYKSNLYIDPAMNIIGPSTHVRDLGVSMSSNCTFDFHISNLYKRCSNLAGWILRTFTTRDPQVMLTLYKSLVMSRLEYASQLWSPYLLKHVYLIEKVQRAFTKHISGMCFLSYSKRLEVLKLYSLQRRRERYGIIYVWKMIEGLVPNLSDPITSQIARLRRTYVAYRWLNTGKVVRCLQRLSNQGPLLYIGAPSRGADGIRVHHIVKLISTTFFVSIHTCLMDNIFITFLHFLYL